VSAQPSPALLRAPKRVLWVLLAVATIAAGLAVFTPRAAAAGWLIAFVFVATIPIGSLEVLMIHSLTGGRWGERLGPVWQNATVIIPLLGIVLIPVLVAMPVLYAWMGDAKNVTPSVAHFYLNWPLYVARSVIALLGWSALALMLPRIGGRPGVLLAGLGMVFQAIMVALVSVDWILSAEPVFISTSFGATIAIVQLLAALDFAALAAPSDLDENTVSDLAGLMLAVTLGLTYINFMVVLVMWYADLPDKIDFFVTRALWPWKWLAIVAFALGSVAPILALLLQKVRLSRRALRAVAISSLTGIALYFTWLLAPVYGPWALATPLLALLCIACAFAALLGAGWPAFLFRHVSNQSPAHE